MKRITYTEKWNDSWFLNLPSDMKLIWVYLCDKCDAGRTWNPDIELAEYETGIQWNENAVFLTLGNHIKKLDDGRWMIFIENNS